MGTRLTAQPPQRSRTGNKKPRSILPRGGRCHWNPPRSPPAGNDDYPAHSLRRGNRDRPDDRRPTGHETALLVTQVTYPAKSETSIRRRPGAEQVVDRQTPTWDGGFGVGHAAAAEDGRGQGVSRPVACDRLGDRVDVPHHLGPAEEVVFPLLGVFPVRRRAVVVFTPDLDREGRRAVDELH